MNAGAMAHTVMGPSEANCPTANSMKKSGRPAMINMIMYGMRNEAEEKQTHILHVFL